MPNTKSAKKRVKTDELRRIQNKVRISEIRTLEKKLRLTLNEGKIEDAKTFLQKTVSLYDKAAKCGTIHKNRANRKKSQLMTLCHKELLVQGTS